MVDTLQNEKKLEGKDSIKETILEKKTVLSKVKDSLSAFQNFLLYGNSKPQEMGDVKKDLQSLEQMIRATKKIEETHSDSEKQSFVSEVVSGSQHSLENLKQETLPMLTIYEAFRPKFDAVSLKLDKAAALKLMNDIVKSGLDPKKPADQGRIEAILDLVNTVPYVISNLLV